MPNKEEFEDKLEKIFDSWVTYIICSVLGLMLIRIGTNPDGLELSGRIILILLGIFFQIPLGYVKIYKIITGESIGQLVHCYLNGCFLG